MGKTSRSPSGSMAAARPRTRQPAENPPYPFQEFPVPADATQPTYICKTTYRWELAAITLIGPTAKAWRQNGLRRRAIEGDDGMDITVRRLGASETFRVKYTADNSSTRVYGNSIGAWLDAGGFGADRPVLDVWTYRIGQRDVLVIRREANPPPAAQAPPLPLPPPAQAQ